MNLFNLKHKRSAPRLTDQKQRLANSRSDAGVRPAVLFFILIHSLVERIQLTTIIVS
jgi:hypothetical protein